MKPHLLFVFNTDSNMGIINIIVLLLILVVIYLIWRLDRLSSEIKRLKSKTHKIQRKLDEYDVRSNMDIPALKPAEKQDQKGGTEEKEIAVEDPLTEIVWKMDKRLEPEEEAVNVFYLASPDKERAFYAPEATVVPDNQTLYVIKDNVLELYDRADNRAMESAINFFEIMIKRVCDVSNSKEAHHSKIVMVQPGRVFKENDDFVVTDKIKVMFQ